MSSNTRRSLTSLIGNTPEPDLEAGIPLDDLPLDPQAAWERQEQNLFASFGMVAPAPVNPPANTPAPAPAPAPAAAVVAPVAPPAPAPAGGWTFAGLASGVWDRMPGRGPAQPSEMMRYVQNHFDGSEVNPAHRAQQDVQLAHRPKQVGAETLTKMKPHDVSAYPRAKGVVVILSNAKEAEGKDVTLKFAIPLQREGRKVFAQFTPDMGDMIRGTVKVEGSDTEEEVEFDFIREQWTTPAQRQASLATMNVVVQSAFEDVVREEQVDAMSSDSVVMQMQQLIRSAERSVAQFYRGEISYADLLKELSAREADILKHASDKKTRSSAKTRQYALAGLTAVIALGSLSFMVWRFGNLAANNQTNRPT
ncbi:hypothetical protein [Falsirhodobacter sp. 20TX0035]|uniref:hypothetical protein n=1 Tax=Falsirhodobacter sp. 20TX0035 TaxID=3022019 RepID=UPI00232C7106|nr:hypothetical protein [Falsirhodobacter sp. 20TX0035]MDB6453059.1 hypothetical protein [Falsirhodobacter sp. 20TX0035]